MKKIIPLVLAVFVVFVFIQSLFFKFTGSQETVIYFALEAELIGEHPVHKIYRLRARGILVAEELAQKLRASDFPHQLFHQVEFEYQRGKDSRGVIAEVFPDGTFLVILDEVPKEWRSDRESVASPTHVHVNPRALSAKQSALAQEYEREILSLPL